MKYRVIETASREFKAQYKGWFGWSSVYCTIADTDVIYATKEDAIAAIERHRNAREGRRYLKVVWQSEQEG